ncbi:Oxygen-insensitive NAD(P)H nitroreductase / Dihydropteridine reductase [hydrothermal vent metagenome]|uniref:Oxygen-insensitive NAD(P)H nitroreductase / Dihydropteridine reductase n=1 Tax=hydrothermal vent metagenome TaxID=652676 RepID=A0A3B0RCR0_9ZZZZ
MNIINKLKWRYATKKFDELVSVTPEKLEVLKEAFNLTATSYGLQPVKLLIIKDKALQANLVKHSMNQEQVAQASHVLVFCVETKIDSKYIESYFHRVKKARDTPDEILNPFKEYLIEDFKEKPKASIKNWAVKQAYLAMGNLLTVCAVEDIDACPMEGFLPESYDKLLGLDKKGLQSVLVMPIGYRAKDDILANLKKVRKEVNESVFEL